MSLKGFIRRSSIVILFALFLLGACSQEEPYLVQIKKGEHILGEKKLIFKLDDETGHPGRIRGLTPDREFYFFNYLNGHIYVYDLQDSVNSIKYKIKVPLDESINFTALSDLYYHNSDSIFLLNRANSFNESSDVFLIDKEGAIVDGYDILNSTTGSPGVQDSSPYGMGMSMYFHQKKIYLISRISLETFKENIKPLIIYDLEKEYTYYEGDFPYVIGEGKAYGTKTDQTSFTLHPKLNKIFYSLPAKSNLFTYDLELKENSIFPFKSEFVREPDFYDRDLNHLDYQLSNEWFGSITYDSYNDVIIRDLTIREGNSSGLFDEGYPYLWFRIDPYTGNYSYFRNQDFNFFTVWFYHPELGAFAQLDTEELKDLENPEDYWILSQVIFDDTFEEQPKE